MISHRIGAALAAMLLLHMTETQAGNVASGAGIFDQQCAACHAVAAKQPGPSLHGVVGRKAGSSRGFAYSPALKAYGKTWDATTLDAYLFDPAGTVPGTSMAFSGLKDENDRQDMLAYLTTLK